MIKWMLNFCRRREEETEEEYCFECQKCGKHCRIKEPNVVFLGEQIGLYHIKCSRCSQAYVFNAYPGITRLSMTKFELGPIRSVSSQETGEKWDEYAQRAYLEYKDHRERERRQGLKHEIVQFPVKRQKRGGRK